ncbi:MAG: hypothetical protein FD173_1475 [Gallionellaceae bacterium]|nr:MAG: hypothetical protein FD173_1475 [Gallionellaceae bacterium]
MSSAAIHRLNKVPAVTIYFWLVKIMCTTVGETAADYLNMDFNFGLTATSLVISALLAIFLVMQVRCKKYVPWLYWTVVLLVSVIGTLITDSLVDNYGVALDATSLAFSLALLATFAIWFKFEKTLSINSIVTHKRELFYWLAILFTFALGTAAGDWMAETLTLGYALSTIIFAGMIGLVAIAHYGFKVNSVLTFWLAYILTRPLGASFADYLSQPLANGGLALGGALTNATFLIAIIALVVYLTVNQKNTLEAQ